MDPSFEFDDTHTTILLRFLNGCLKPYQRSLDSLVDVVRDESLFFVLDFLHRTRRAEPFPRFSECRKSSNDDQIVKKNLAIVLDFLGESASGFDPDALLEGSKISLFVWRVVTHYSEFPLSSPYEEAVSFANSILESFQLPLISSVDSWKNPKIWQALFYSLLGFDGAEGLPDFPSDESDLSLLNRLVVDVGYDQLGIPVVTTGQELFEGNVVGIVTLTGFVRCWSDRPVSFSSVPEIPEPTPTEAQPEASIFVGDEREEGPADEGSLDDFFGSSAGANSTIEQPGDSLDDFFGSSAGAESSTDKQPDGTLDDFFGTAKGTDDVNVAPSSSSLGDFFGSAAPESKEDEEPIRKVVLFQKPHATVPDAEPQPDSGARVLFERVEARPLVSEPKSVLKSEEEVGEIDMSDFKASFLRSFREDSERRLAMHKIAEEQTMELVTSEEPNVWKRVHAFVSEAARNPRRPESKTILGMEWIVDRPKRLFRTYEDLARTGGVKKGD